MRRNTAAARNLATADVEVPAPDMSGFDLEGFAIESSKHIDTDALEAEVVEKMAAKKRPQKNVTPTVEVLPEPTSVMDALRAASEEKKRAQSAARKANGTATTKPDAKKPTAAKATKPKATAKPKAEPKPKVVVERVPVAKLEALIAEVGINKSQYAKALGVSPSLASEHFGKGRGHLLAASRWTEVEKAVRKFAKGLR